MKIREVNDYADFLSLKDEWTDLLQNCNHNLFSTWDWLSTWWKHFGNGKKLCLLLAEEKGRTVGIAPLMYSVHTMFGLRRGQIEFIGTPHTDYNNFILTQKKDECLRLFVDHIYGLSEKWECIDLSDIPANAECLPFLRNVSTTLKPFHKCPYLPLPTSIEQLFKNMGSNGRKYLRRGRRKLEAAFDVELTDFCQPQSWAEGMQHVLELHQKRWMRAGFSGAFSDENFVNFTRDIAESFSRKNWLGLYALKLSGVTVAAEYGFIYNNVFHSYIPGFDPKYASYSVGNMLRLYSIEKFINDGLVGFDFMRGAEEHKNRWHPNIRWTRKSILTRKGFSSRVKHRLYSEYWYQGDRIQYVLKLKK